MLPSTKGGGEAEVASLSTDGTGMTLHADGDAVILVLPGEPTDEPIVGCGPFMMDSEAESRQAIEDFNTGRFGQMAAA